MFCRGLKRFSVTSSTQICWTPFCQVLWEGKLKICSMSQRSSYMSHQRHQGWWRDGDKAMSWRKQRCWCLNETDIVQSRVHGEGKRVEWRCPGSLGVLCWMLLAQPPWWLPPCPQERTISVWGISVFPQCCCYSLSDIVSNLSLLFWLLTPNSFTFCEHQLFSSGLGAPGDASHLSCPSWCRSKRSCVVISLDVKLKEMEWFHFLFAFTLASLWMLLVDVFIKDALMSKYK